MIAYEFKSLDRSLHDVTNRDLSLTPSGHTSSASSASLSVFSTDGNSSQSSAPSSSKSVAISWDSDSSSADCQNTLKVASVDEKLSQSGVNNISVKVQCTDIPVAPQLRLHPRRTQASGYGGSCNLLTPARPPPTLVRQCDRKDNFVESLVDTTTQMIEVIWPLSVVPCGRDTALSGKNLIGLRTFIQEVLKRSKTSYSTLQVALYYLVLIKSHVPKVDFTKAQLEDTHTSRAMQCGRRMFLAALILASKYLQDRNYSARAWSKISGLKIAEINSNEIAFVTAIDWKLHVPESQFHRWTDVVLKFSQSPPVSYPTISSHSWRSIIPHLTPELDDSNLDIIPLVSCKSETPASTSMSPPPRTQGSSLNIPNDHIQLSIPPRPLVMEPTLRLSKEHIPFPPISPKISQLPTPQMTPNSQVFHTPAASCKSSESGRSMSSAMKQIHTLSMLRCTLDSYPSTNRTDGLTRPPTMSNFRVQYSQPNYSVVSSPESMISDVSSMSSRTSRSSSISSISSSGAPVQATRLAVLATRRCATMTRLRGETQLEDYARTDTDSEWAIMGTFPSAAQESFVRGIKENTPMKSVLDTSILQDSNCTNSSRSELDMLSHRKRSHSRSNFHLQEEIKELLSQGSSKCQLQHDLVLPDSNRANSFLLREEMPRDQLATPGFAKRSNRIPLISRKRPRCQYEERQTQSGDTHMSTPVALFDMVLPC